VKVAEMTQMRIREVTSCPRHRRAIIVLEDVAARQRLTFYADVDEARRLAQELQRGAAACHPIFDFIRSLLQAVDARPALVVLEDVDGLGVGARVHVRCSDGEVVVPCYPPDALTLALRADVPVYATPDVLRQAAAPPPTDPDDVTRWLDGLKPTDFSNTQDG
jgi:bifunctional DNase/RNase